MQKYEYAYPLAQELNQYGDLVEHAHHGMPILHWFAGLAMQGMLGANNGTGVADEMARWSFDYAEAMVAEGARRMEAK